ncbi:hypothetical protein ROZALSC1DRAFT_30593 [Rozella allomycis CSF55]|uniref:RGS domain-containing protein n=1 Tax=Rozella allomycis (strain CSF55) TaxID=988480 RepID=A0A4V1IZD0_ROZAC|nr:hypothetical protein ROZALSC1DRAFT_30593 [Rozella allomycis CSF55]
MDVEEVIIPFVLLPLLYSLTLLWAYQYRHEDYLKKRMFPVLFITTATNFVSGISYYPFKNPNSFQICWVQQIFYYSVASYFVFLYVMKTASVIIWIYLANHHDPKKRAKKGLEKPILLFFEAVSRIVNRNAKSKDHESTHAIRKPDLKVFLFCSFCFNVLQIILFSIGFFTTLDHMYDDGCALAPFYPMIVLVFTFMMIVGYFMFVLKKLKDNLGMVKECKMIFITYCICLPIYAILDHTSNDPATKVRTSKALALAVAIIVHYHSLVYPTILAMKFRYIKSLISLTEPALISALNDPSSFKQIKMVAIESLAVENILFLEELKAFYDKIGEKFTYAKNKNENDNLVKMSPVLTSDKSLIVHTNLTQLYHSYMEQIYESFIKAGSPNELNLTNEVRKEFEVKMGSSDFSLSIFNPLKDEVLKIIFQNVFPSFQQNMYVGIVASVRITWPESWKSVLQYASYLRLNFLSQFSELKIPQVDVRAQHIFLANVFPLVLAILLLIFFKSPKVVVWYVSLLASIGLLLVGLVSKFIGNSDANVIPTSSALSDIFLITGGVMAGLMILIFLGNYLLERRRKMKQVSPAREDDSKSDESSDDSSKPESEHELRESKANLEQFAYLHYKSKSFWVMFRNLVLSVILIFIGIICLSWLDLTKYTTLSFINIAQKALVLIGAPLGGPLIGFGSLLLINFMLNCHPKGRKYLTDLNFFWKKNVLKIALLLLSLSYIPISSSIFGMINCRLRQCSAGNEFYSHSVAYSSDLSDISATFLALNAPMCQSCNFTSDCSLATTTLCPGGSDYRLVEDPSFSCSSEIFYYYTPGAILMLISFTIGVPYLFHRVISISTSVIQQLPINVDDQSIKWKIMVHTTNSSCKSLFAMFEHKWKNYKLLLVLQKLIIVSVFIFARDLPFPLVCLMFVTQTVFAGLAIYSQPYISRIEVKLNLTGSKDFSSLSCCIISALNAVVAFLISFKDNFPTIFPYTIPEYIIYPLGVLNSIVPIGAAVLVIAYGFIYPEKNVIEQLQEAEKSKQQETVKNTSILRSTALLDDKQESVQNSQTASSSG